MPPEKRALDPDHDRSSASKKSKREADEPRDWRAAYFDHGSPKRRPHRDQDPREKGSDRDRHRDRSYDRAREKERSHPRPDPQHGSSSSTQRYRGRYETIPDARRDSLARAPPSAPRAMLHQPPNDEREEGEYVLPLFLKAADTESFVRISPRPTE